MNYSCNFAYVLGQSTAACHDKHITMRQYKWCPLCNGVFGVSDMSVDQDKPKDESREQVESGMVILNYYFAHATLV